MKLLSRWGGRLRGDEVGQGLVEYSLLLSLVSLAAVAALVAFGGARDAMYTALIAALQ